MKIVLHGFGSYPIVFRHLIEAAHKTAPQIDWAIILPLPHHHRLMRAVIGGDDILSLRDHLVRGVRPLQDTSVLQAYPGNIFADIEAEKRAFKHRPAAEQLSRAAEIYHLYKAFLERVRPTHVLVPQIEGYDGRVLPGLAASLGIDVMVPTGLRNIGGTFFSSDATEILPPRRRPSAMDIEAARALLARFRAEGIPASVLIARPDSADDELLSSFREPVPVRVAKFARRNLLRPDLFEREYLRISLLNNLPQFRDALWWVTTKRAENQFDAAGLADLPARFVYFPLQMTPESSINTPAPYFVDQLRAIDAIRFAMPNDYLLVVKEHPSAIATRTPAFVRALRRRAGVVVAHYKMASRALTERASLTMSVTGTATLEAFLLGRPSLTLGPSFFAEYLGGVCPVGALHARMRNAIDHPPTDDEIIRAIAEIISVRYDFEIRPPGLPGEPMLRRGNIERFLAAILDHTTRGKTATSSST